ncbi:amino acid adenylation domain-containing protein [Kitasatospora sp. KL5]|uniref:amino acid adenylation domain-containing protein n=1 Tax=Kitasatospora sp. KL5 TaxID=3425125 RepID=UPI003D6FCF09
MSDLSILARFRRCCERFGDRVALSDEHTSLTYAELGAEADRLAARLVEQGVRAGDVVAVLTRRSVDGIVALLAVVSAGAAYLALDTRYPAARTEFMLRDSKARLVITQRDLADGLPAGVATVFADDRAPSGAGAAGRAAADPSGEDLAYVAYTSGSTGTPKGVMVPHRGVVRLVVDPDYVTITPEDVFLQIAPVAFDASTFEIWGALLNGAHLVVAPAGDLSLAEITGFVRASGVTVLLLTTGLLHQVVDHGLDDLKQVRYLLTGGDVLSADHADRAVAALPGTTLVNGYGPTENTTYTCCHAFDSPLRTSAVPIGRAINGTWARVLDADLRPVAPGGTGELYTGGTGLSHGYLGRPALTAERFLPDPDGDGERMYRTGDLVRSTEPAIEFLGRADRQVKIRGFRIELGEVEAAFAGLPAVAQYHVGRTESPTGGHALHAALVLRKDHRRTSLLELRRALADVLPAYAVPSLITVVDEFPLTANGKVDAAALAARTRSRSPQLMTEYREPGSPAEHAVVSLWSDHFGMEGIGADDDFFELGGHSLLGVKIIAELHQAFGVDVSPRDFYFDPTPAGMARLVASRAAK